MTTLHGTSPHPVCCIVPHEFKKSGTSQEHASQLEAFSMCEVGVRATLGPLVVTGVDWGRTGH